MFVFLQPARRHARAWGIMLGVVALLGAPATAQDQAAPPAAPPAASADASKPLAKVGDKTITQGDVDEYVGEVMQNRMGQMGGMQGMGGNQMGEQMKAFETQLRSNAVSDLIRQELVQSAIDAELKNVPEAEVNAQVSAIQSFFSKQGQDLSEVLTQRGKTIEDLKGDTRKQIALKRLMAAEVGLQDPTDEELTSKFNEIDKQNLTMPERVRASHILIGFGGNPRDPQAEKPSDEAKAAKKKTADEVYARAQKGEDFKKLAEEFSDDPGSKTKGGDLDFFGRGMMVPEFEKAAFGAKTDTITEPVESQFGYHIIKVTDHKDTQTLGLDDIRFQLHEQMVAERIQSKMSEFMNKLGEKAKVERLDGGKWPPEPPANPPHGAPGHVHGANE